MRSVFIFMLLLLSSACGGQTRIEQVVVQPEGEVGANQRGTAAHEETLVLPEAVQDSATLVGEGWISTPKNDYNLGMDAASRLMVFARSEPDFKQSRIWFAERKGQGWSTPMTVPFSDPRYRDSDPWLTPDGRTLFFISDRPVVGETPSGNLDIWRVAVDGKSFGKPEHLDALSSEGDELGPELHDGWLYFNSSRKGGPARLSIYRARMNGEGFGTPEPLPSPFNDGTVQGDYTLSPDGRLAVFWSRRGESEDLDLFIVCRMAAGWSHALRLPSPINAPGIDFTPAFSADGMNMYFSSVRTKDGIPDANTLLNGQSNVYVVPASMLEEALQTMPPYGEGGNCTASSIRPSGS